MIRLENILTPGRSLVNVPGGSKKRVLEQIAKVIAQDLTDLDSQTIFESLIAREKLGSTGFGNGIAIPHCRMVGCNAPLSAVLRLETPVDFDAIDDQPVDLVFLLLAPEGAGADHLKALARISRILRDRAFCEKLRGSENPDALFALLMEAGNAAPDHFRAAS